MPTYENIERSTYAVRPGKPTRGSTSETHQITGPTTSRQDLRQGKPSLWLWRSNFPLEFSSLHHYPVKTNVKE